MECLISFKDKEVLIGPNHPFVVIGERINPTRRKKLAESINSGDFSLVQQDAVNQVNAGGQVLDINAGIPGGDESSNLRRTVEAVTQVVDVPLCIDTANPEALEAALEIYPGKALINSTTAEEEMMAEIFPLARKYGAAVIGVITDEEGIPATPQARLEAARKMINRAAEYNIPAEDIIIDPLALTIGADHNAGRVTLDSISLIGSELGVNMSLGASNVSFGLPDRRTINTAYLALGISRGLTAAITDPTVVEIRTTILAADLLMGRDEYAMNWIKAFRKRSSSN
jgi:5-methyltetrahydrofolate--homocysteine methyltransferase